MWLTLSSSFPSSLVVTPSTAEICPNLLALRGAVLFCVVWTFSSFFFSNQNNAFKKFISDLNMEFVASGKEFEAKRMKLAAKWMKFEAKRMEFEAKPFRATAVT